MKISFVPLFLLLTIYSGFSQETENTISGRVTDFGQPISNAIVIVNGSTKIVKTNSEGFYTIKAKPRDILTFSHGRMRPMEIIVEDVTSILNIQMSPKIEELDEVVVKNKKTKTRKDLESEYITNKDLVRTSFGMFNKKSMGFASVIIDESEINTAYTSFLDIIRGKFNGRIRDADVLNPQVFFNSGFKTLKGPPPPAIYDLDGQVLIDAPIFIAVQDIRRIMIISGAGAQSRYGNRGAGGVIVINTKRGIGYDESFDYAVRGNNFFDEKTISSVSLTEFPKHLKELYDAATEKNALSVFNNQRAAFGKKPYYLLDVATYFRTKWKNIDKAQEIYREIEDEFSDNASVLKVLTYYYEEFGNKAAALELYKQIFKLRPRYSQSYRDLANSYMELGQIKNAIKLYSRYAIYCKMDTLPPPEKNFIAIDSVIKVEARYAMKQDALDKGISNVAQANYHWPVRILVEWNNSEAEFDLQFVHPENYYYNWEHTQELMPERILDEKLRGYSCEQFLLDENSAGKWMINLKYLGNKSFDPTYLKITTFHNYGTSKQKKNIRVVKLWEKNVNQNLFSLHSDAKIVTR